MALRALSLFAGIGGLDLGLRLAVPGSRTVCFVERDPYAAATLVARMADATLHPAPLWDDITTFDALAWRGCVDIVLAGFNCQPFSVAGKRKGTDDERWLWDDIARIIRDCDAPLCFFENVPPLVRHGLPTILGDLAEMGFAAEWGCFKASDVGTPHRRERWFLLAHRSGDGHIRRRSAWPEEGPVSRGNSAVADAGGGLVPLAEWRPEARDGTRPTGPIPVADTESIGRVQSGPARNGRPGLADASPGGYWPPGPGERERWAELPESAQPAIRKLANGSADGVDGALAYRADQLRCLGNAVVPACAALAFRVLAERLELGFLIGDGVAQVAPLLSPGEGM